MISAMKWIRLIWMPLILWGLLCTPAPAWETQSLDGKPALFYKLINFWHTCLADEARLLCGHTVTWETRGNLVFTHDRDRRRLTLVPHTGIPDFFYLEPLALAVVGGDGWTGGEVFSFSPGTGLAMENVSSDQVARLRAAGGPLSLVITGTIQGLKESGLALFPVPEMDRSCPDTPREPLEIRLVSQGEILLRLTPIFH